MSADVRSVRELWNSLFDNSLENCATEDVQFRSLAMVFHILQLEFQKTKLNYHALQRKYEKQSKEILAHDVKSSESPQLLACKNLVRSPLKTISTNETTPSKKKQDISMFEVDEDADLFNHQINETDLSKENDNSLFINDSLNDFDTPKSPTLNKSRKERGIKKVKRNITLNESADCSVILGTPMKLVPNLKQSKLSTLNSFVVSKLKNTNTTKCHNGTKTSQTSNNKSNFTGYIFNDSDATMCPVVHKSVGSVEVSVKELEDCALNSRHKKARMDNSYDCVPEQPGTSPEYAYKREAVRKREERLKLQGWACEDCEKYYTKFHHLSDEELQKRMDLCSRHRSKFNPNILTPKGFWDLDFPPTQESLKFDV